MRERKPRRPLSATPAIGTTRKYSDLNKIEDEMEPGFPHLSGSPTPL
jgi:hypothetical protein